MKATTTQNPVVTAKLRLQSTPGANLATVISAIHAELAETEIYVSDFDEVDIDVSEFEPCPVVIVDLPRIVEDDPQTWIEDVRVHRPSEIMKVVA